MTQPSSKRVILLAHNRREAELHLLDDSARVHVYTIVVNQDQLVGIEADEVETTKLFWTRRDAKELYELARTRIRPRSGNMDNTTQVPSV